MTDPNSQDDDWQELARELGLQKSSAPAERTSPAADRRPELVAPPEDDPETEPVGEERPARTRRAPEPAAEVEDAGLTEGETETLADAAEADLDDAEESEGEGAEGEPGGEEQPGGEGQPGTGRKRRRRRRRRKKGAADAAAAPAGPATAGSEDEDEPAGYGVTARPIGGGDAEPDVEPEAEDAVGDEDEAEEGGAVPLAAEEETGGEVLRDLIANWNVPSWDEIVGGLYRPER